MKKRARGRSYVLRTRWIVEVTVPRTRAQIARHVGTVKRCVARVLRSFEERGIIDVDRRGLPRHVTSRRR